MSDDATTPTAPQDQEPEVNATSAFRRLFRKLPSQRGQEDASTTALEVDTSLPSAEESSAELIAAVRQVVANGGRVVKAEHGQYFHVDDGNGLRVNAYFAGGKSKWMLTCTKTTASAHSSTGVREDEVYALGGKLAKEAFSDFENMYEAQTVEDKRKATERNLHVIERFALNFGLRDSVTPSPSETPDLPDGTPSLIPKTNMILSELMVRAMRKVATENEIQGGHRPHLHGEYEFNDNKGWRLLVYKHRDRIAGGSRYGMVCYTGGVKDSIDHRVCQLISDDVRPLYEEAARLLAWQRETKLRQGAQTAAREFGS